MPKLVNKHQEGSGCWNDDAKLTFMKWIFANHHEEMLSYAAGLLCSSQGLLPDVNDLLNDFYIRVYDKALIIQPPYQKYGLRYLRRIVKTLFLQKIRQGKAIDRNLTNWVYLNEEQYDGEQTAVAQVTLGNLKEWLSANLKEEHAVVFFMYAEGYSYKEIEEATGIKSGSIGSIISRTRNKLER
ncbi:MAG: RNA polymerase sigma factor [Bacteroidota bacterium]